jgi:hypothetical protein
MTASDHKAEGAAGQVRYKLGVEAGSVNILVLLVVSFPHMGGYKQS